MLSLTERAAKLGLRFDVRGLRDFVLVDERNGNSYDFPDGDALREFLAANEQQAPPLRHRPPRQRKGFGRGRARG